MARLSIYLYINKYPEKVHLARKMSHLAPLLSNYTICCTGLEEELRIAVQKKTEALGGRYSAHLTKDCSHLIAGTLAKSQKYKSALILGIPTVHVAWIEECWNAAHLNSGPIDEQRKLLHQMALKKYSVCGLNGCLISVTGVAFEERSKISSMVQELGGIYSPELKPQCSHLIFHQLIDNNPEMSSQQSQSIPIKVQYARKWNIPVVTKDWIYACYNKRMLLEESDFQACPISIAGHIEEFINENLPVKLEDIKENTVSFLNGCYIYLNGESISSQRLAVLKRLVLASGGVRYNDLETGPPTHIVIHNQLLPNSLKDYLDNNNSGDPKLVHDNWLFDSFKAGRRLPEDDYEVNKKPLAITAQSTLTSAAPQKWKSAFNHNLTTAVANTSTNLSVNNGSFLNANPNSSFGPLRTGMDGEEFLAGTPNIMECASKVLKGKSVFFALPSAKARKLASKAKKIGIDVVDKEIEADWCITSVLISIDQYKKLTTRRSSAHLRNEIWFEAAVDSQTCLPSMSFAHPFPVRSLPIPQLNKFIISQSGFSGAEREFYAELIKTSGANYTDSLSKKNTHLLIEEPGTGLKFEFAKKCNIECININWFKNHFSLMNISGSVDENIFTINNSQLTSKFISAKSQEQDFSQTFKSQTVLFNSQLSQAKLSFQSQVVERIPSSIQGSSDVTNKSEIFKGLVFASSQRLWHRREELSSVIESLGGVFLWSFDRNCTHYLHQGNLKEEAFKEFKQARQWDKFIVSPWWIFRCKEMKERVDELMYPHTYKDTSSCDNEEIIVEPITKDNDNFNSLASDKNTSSNGVIPAPSPQISLDWDSIMAERKAQEIRFRPGSKTFNIDAAAHSAATLTHIDASNYKIISETERGNGNFFGSLPKFKVIFSGYSSSEKNELISLISTRPEFQVLAEDESVEWNHKSTILICNSVNYTEKVFSACATGCWILKKEFFLNKATEDQFEKYELGPNWNSNENDSLIGKIPRYWRKKFMEADLTNIDVRPFKDWKCVLIIETSRLPLFESVLKNGGAQIISLSPVSSISIIKQITHVFCGNVNAIPEEFRSHFKAEQIFTTKHIINTIFTSK